MKPGYLVLKTKSDHRSYLEALKAYFAPLGYTVGKFAGKWAVKKVKK